jgi:hypothetical protein
MSHKANRPAPGNLTVAGKCKSCGWSAADCDCGPLVGTDADNPFECEGADGVELVDLDFGGEDE